ncbi:MAG: hypothetical protein H7199_10905 [Burkholderiales bacterium]|nr:hypothetical protein [Flavobacterium sp.]
MKKLIFLLSFTAVVWSCKKKEPITAPINKMAAAVAGLDCSFFSPLDTLSNPQDRVTWLRLNQVEACKEKYDTCRVNAHLMDSKYFDKAVADYWQSNSVNYTGYNLEDIKALTSEQKYGQFLCATPDSNSNIKLTVVSAFTVSPACFSIPLFYGIGRINALNEKTQLIFTRGKVGGQETVVFFLSGSSGHCYDMSKEPL